jgi:Fe-S cluster assembly protein SufD
MTTAQVATPSLPSGREEAWRFTPLARIMGVLDGSIESGKSLVANLSAPEGVEISTKTGSAPLIDPQDFAATLVISKASEVLVIEIPAELEVNEPILLDRAGASLSQANFERILIKAGRHSKATVIVNNSGSAILSEDVEIELGDGAHLTFTSLQEWENDATHLGRHQALIGKDAKLTLIEVTLGGATVRLLPRVNFLATGGEVDAYGLYFATSGQHLEHRVHVEHDKPHCRSRVTYKGALLGESARTVWFGDVAIRPTAIGTDTYELNRNLLLSDGARADSVPNLEIETGEIVGAGHASATGRFDDDQLFYLMSRGIPSTEARRLVLRGFFAELLRNIKVETIEERLMARIDRELEQANA